MNLKRPAIVLLLALVLGAGVAAGWLLFGDDDDAEPAAAPVGDLFTQTAQGGSFAKQGERFVLTLRDVAPATTVFSDRPERRSDSIATEDFVAAYADAFADDPPNATLSSLERGQGEFTVELLRPRYDATTDTLSYTVSPIGAEGAPLPDRFGSASLFIDSGAQTASGPGYACTRGQEADAVWVCTFNDSANQVTVSDLVQQLPGTSAGSAFCLQAWGGAGGNGATAAAAKTGRGGDGGYARTIAQVDASTTIGYLLGKEGLHRSVGGSGTGGSSTIVGTGAIDGSSASSAPATNRDFVESALLVAGGGGGGSYGDAGKIGHDGGDGGTAVAASSSDATDAGGDGHGRHGGKGGNGTGGSGTKDGGDGPGGVGGNSTDGTNKLDGPGWGNLRGSADPQGDPGEGGATSPVAPSPLYAGGAGGGGYGGGGSGRSHETDPGSGGGGGGSLAKQADVDDSSAPSECSDPPSLSASFRIVVFSS